MNKIKPLKPSMREKKRYLAFELQSARKLPADADKLLVKKLQSMLGVFGSAKAGLMSLRYDQTCQRGLLRIERGSVDEVRACFVLLKEIVSEPVLAKTLTMSGMLNKAAMAVTEVEKCNQSNTR